MKLHVRRRVSMDESKAVEISMLSPVDGIGFDQSAQSSFM